MPPNPRKGHYTTNNVASVEVQLDGFRSQGARGASRLPIRVDVIGDQLEGDEKKMLEGVLRFYFEPAKRLKRCVEGLAILDQWSSTSGRTVGVVVRGGGCGGEEPAASST